VCLIFSVVGGLSVNFDGNKSHQWRRYDVMFRDLITIDSKIHRIVSTRSYFQVSTAIVPVLSCILVRQICIVSTVKAIISVPTKIWMIGDVPKVIRIVRFWIQIPIYLKHYIETSQDVLNISCKTRQKVHIFYVINSRYWDRCDITEINKVIMSRKQLNHTQIFSVITNLQSQNIISLINDLEYIQDE